ncbi:MAG: hypothetical protein OXN96_01400 [Bryobacterales bacterium]|nr:hypothetical protein [Bryobacterales bacterium]
MVEHAGMDRDLCDGGTKYILIPMLPFAVELCLKALKAQGGKEFIKTHNLKSLWQDLSKEQQAEVRSRVENPEYRKHESKQRESCGITGKMRTLDEVIEAHQSDFDEWRYVADGVKKLTPEKKSMNIDEAFMDLFMVVHACVGYHKEREGRHVSATTSEKERVASSPDATRQPHKDATASPGRAAGAATPPQKAEQRGACEREKSKTPNTTITIAKTGIVERGSVNVKLTRETVESSAAQIDQGLAIPVIPNHDPFAMPIAKITEAWVEPLGDEYALKGRMHIDDAPSVEVHGETGVALTRLDFKETPKPFARKAYGEADKGLCKLSVDMANFDSVEDYTRFANDVRIIDDSIVCGNGLGRHSLTPDPFIEFIVSNPELAAILAWLLRRAEKFVRHTFDETFKRVGTYISGPLSARIIGILKSYRSRSAKDHRATVVQIVIPGELELCLLVKIESNEEFPVLCLKKIADELEKYRDVLNEADKIILARVNTNDWKFLYATTRSGKVIGTLECYKSTLESMRSVVPDEQQ